MKIKKLSTASLCQFFNKTSQAYYKKIKRNKIEKFQEEIVLKLVTDIRKILPKIGVRKLYYILNRVIQI